MVFLRGVTPLLYPHPSVRVAPSHKLRVCDMRDIFSRVILLRCARIKAVPEYSLLIPAHSRNFHELLGLLRNSGIRASGQPHSIQMGVGGDWKNEVRAVLHPGED